MVNLFVSKRVDFLIGYLSIAFVCFILLFIADEYLFIYFSKGIFINSIW